MRDTIVDAIVFWREVAPLIIGVICLVVLAVGAAVRWVVKSIGGSGPRSRHPS